MAPCRPLRRGTARRIRRPLGCARRGRLGGGTSPMSPAQSSLSRSLFARGCRAPARTTSSGNARTRSAPQVSDRACTLHAGARRAGKTNCRRHGGATASRSARSPGGRKADPRARWRIATGPDGHGALCARLSTVPSSSARLRPVSFPSSPLCRRPRRPASLRTDSIHEDEGRAWAEMPAPADADRGVHVPVGSARHWGTPPEFPPVGLFPPPPVARVLRGVARVDLHQRSTGPCCLVVELRDDSAPRSFQDAAVQSGLRADVPSGRLDASPRRGRPIVDLQILDRDDVEAPHQPVGNPVPGVPAAYGRSPSEAGQLRGALRTVVAAAPAARARRARPMACQSSCSGAMVSPVLSVGRRRTPRSMPTLPPVRSRAEGACSYARSTVPPWLGA